MEKKIIVLIVTLFLIVPFYNLKAESGILITPSFNELKLKAGESYEGNFTIKNNNEYNIDLEVSKGEILPDGSIKVVENTDSSANWLSTTNTNISINSLTEFTFTYKVTIPDGIVDQTSQPFFILKLLSEGSEGGTTAGVTQLIPFQLRIFVSENKNYNANLEIAKLQISKNILIGTDQKISFEVKNPSPSPSKPLIQIQVVSPDNNVIYQKVENDSLAVLLTDQIISKENNIQESLTSEMKFGRHTVELLVTDTLTNQSKIQKVHFYYIPPVLIVVLVFGVVLLVLLIILIRRFRNINTAEKKKNHLFMYK